MKVLVTGASGYIGGGVVRALQSNGHEVIAVARPKSQLPDDVERRLGDLADSASLAKAARDVDGVIHAGAIPDDADGQIDIAATRALTDAVADTGGFFVHTSGTWIVGASGDTALDEDAPVNPPGAVAWRPRAEEIVREVAARGVRASIVRPATVYGHGAGYIAALLAPFDGAVRLFGDGTHRWSVVHVDDLGELYRLAAESAPAGAVFNGVSGVVRMRDAADAAAAAAGVPIARWDPAKAEQVWGVWQEAFTMDHVASGDRARRALGWSPIRHGLLDELRRLETAGV